MLQETIAIKFIPNLWVCHLLDQVNNDIYQLVDTSHNITSLLYVQWLSRHIATNWNIPLEYAGQ